ncbi:MAG TPA: hypothetical protein VF475_05685 [Sphingobium sp.]
MGLLAEEIGRRPVPAELTSRIVEQEDEGIVADLSTSFPDIGPDALSAEFLRCRAFAGNRWSRSWAIQRPIGWRDRLVVRKPIYRTGKERLAFRPSSQTLGAVRA